MANNQRGGGIQRPNGATQSKICQFKLVLLGESAVGKSSLVLRFVKGQFHEYQESTIGAAFLTQTVHIDDTAVKFEIWVSFRQMRFSLDTAWHFTRLLQDTAGQERYHSLAPMYYRGAQAAIVVYDIQNQDSFVRAQTWVKELQRQVSSQHFQIHLPTDALCSSCHCRHHPTSLSLWLETRLTWRRVGLSTTKKRNNTPTRTVCCLWKHPRRRRSMSMRYF